MASNEITIILDAIKDLREDGRNVVQQVSGVGSDVKDIKLYLIPEIHARIKAVEDAAAAHMLEDIKFKKNLDFIVTGQQAYGLIGKIVKNTPWWVKAPLFTALSAMGIKYMF